MLKVVLGIVNYILFFVEMDHLQKFLTMHEASNIFCYGNMMKPNQSFALERDLKVEPKPRIMELTDAKKENPIKTETKSNAGMLQQNKEEKNPNTSNSKLTGDGGVELPPKKAPLIENAANMFEKQVTPDINKKSENVVNKSNN